MTRSSIVDERPVRVAGGQHFRPGRRRTVRWGVLVVVPCLVLSVLLGRSIMTTPEPVGPQVPGLTVGVTHTQASIDPWEPAAAVSRATQVLSSVAPVQNQHLMGWGSLNPEPSPGVYDWTSLDQRMATITGMGAEPVLTLCCSPDWMKGGAAGQTDWNRIEVAPTPDHFDDFARLAAQAAQRYPQVHHFLVWNELKGFFDDATNDWDAAGYTDLYNRVYAAVKQVRPDAQVGGPYVVMDSWSSQATVGYRSQLAGPWGYVDQRSLDVVDYWLAHAVGADFVVVDGGTTTRDRGLTTSDFTATAKLAAVTEWLRSRTELPVWWAEIYADTNDPNADPGDPRRAAVMADALVAVAKAGASVALIWQPQESSGLDSAALFTDTGSADGGGPLPLVAVLEALGAQLRDDPRLVTRTWDESKSEWRLTTPDWVVRWSAEDGLRAPVANDLFFRLTSWARG
jgi:hypothetical protein